ncbi:MAG: hypothetical protein MJ041_03800 [Acidaminococcaceae bacterium]|nr:hypothetical protein [Acidaminococcaceae bacterium]
MDKKYEEIVNLEYVGVKNHVPADRMARAAQFSAFAALSGHDRYIREVERKNQEYHENLHRGELEESC